jgi:Restriction alleviation protein Lar
MTEPLKPCPFCGEGVTEVRPARVTWDDQTYDKPTSYSVWHWCKRKRGQPPQAIERVGKDETSAIEAWNNRAV